MLSLKIRVTNKQEVKETGLCRAQEVRGEVALTGKLGISTKGQKGRAAATKGGGEEGIQKKKKEVGHEGWEGSRTKKTSARREQMRERGSEVIDTKKGRGER